jgi:hypothetical protein|tara:strand:- start:198 stop:1886 length:1689 start_codon:yes stop_codon:yes gene_type:complete
MPRNKPIPRSQRLIFNRGEKISRNSPGAKDDVKNVSVGIMDMDSAIMYYFNEVIKPEVEINKEKVKVPCIYASPERWNQISKQGYLRDKKKQIITPLIAFKRTGMTRNENMPIDKLDANEPKHFYTFQKRYTQQNRFDKFSVQNNLVPNNEYFNVSMPDYMNLTYEFTIWTSYIEQMNTIVEKINYSDGAYWGQPGKMRFRTSIESFSDSSQVEGERLIRTTFSVNLYGYILPETFDSKTTTQKYLTPKKLIVRESTEKTLVDGSGTKVDLSSNAVEVGESTKDIFSISVESSLIFNQGTGVTISNTGVGFDGSSELTQQFSIGQDVATTANVQFNQVTASNSIQIGDASTIYSSTGINGSIDITGSLETTGDLTVQGDTTITGTLTANEFHTTFTSASIILASGSTRFGDTLDDTHEFTGSVDVTGSFSLNGYEINEISNDGDMTDGSTTSVPTENAVKTYITNNVSNTATYLRKNFFKSSASITNATTASFTAVTASAPVGMTSTTENDFVFFINGQYMEHNALAIQQKGSSLELHVHTGSIGYILESDDEILSIGKFNS